MENTKHRQMESRAAAGAMNHKREGYLTWDEYLPCFPECAPRIQIPRLEPAL